MKEIQSTMFHLFDFIEKNLFSTRKRILKVFNGLMKLHKDFHQGGSYHSKAKWILCIID